MFSGVLASLLRLAIVFSLIAPVCLLHFWVDQAQVNNFINKTKETFIAESLFRDQSTCFAYPKGTMEKCL